QARVHPPLDVGRKTFEPLALDERRGEEDRIVERRGAEAETASSIERRDGQPTGDQRREPRPRHETGARTLFRAGRFLHRGTSTVAEMRSITSAAPSPSSSISGAS